jgi:4-hydroxy-3-polyprenylbenzoate decarboxylase
MHWQIHKDAAADWRGMGERMDVAVALGARPDHRLHGLGAAAQAHRRADAGRLPARRAGGARARPHRRPGGAGSRRDRDRGVHREGRAGRRGPFGDHTGYYTPVEPFPVLHVTAITMRRDAIYPSIIVGVPPQEDVWLGKATSACSCPRSA